MHTFDYLLDRNREWVQKKIHQDPHYFERLTAGQSPKALFIGCSDSRLAPTEMTGAELGELFMSRNVGNVVSSVSHTMMSELEYAIFHLGVRHVIVCGHYNCGAVKAAYEGGDLEEHIVQWLTHIQQPLLQHKSFFERLDSLDEQLRFAEVLNVLVQSQRVHNIDEFGSVNPVIHSWYFYIPSGQIIDLNHELDFSPCVGEFELTEPLFAKIRQLIEDKLPTTVVAPSDMAFCGIVPSH